MDVTAVVAVVAVFTGVALLAQWYYRAHLGTPRGRLSWVLPAVGTVAFAVLAAFGGDGWLAWLAVAGAAVTGVEYALYRRDRRRGPQADADESVVGTSEGPA